MSTEEENFDEILKSKLDGELFSFNEANWDKAEAMILAADKKRKRRIIAFIFFIGLLIGVGVMIPFISHNDVSVGKNKNIAQATYQDNNKEEATKPVDVKPVDVKQQSSKEYIQQQNLTKEEKPSETVSNTKKEIINSPEKNGRSSAVKNEIKGASLNKTIASVNKPAGKNKGIKNVSTVENKNESVETPNKSNTATESKHHNGSVEKSTSNAKNETEPNNVVAKTDASVPQKTVAAANESSEDSLSNQTPVIAATKKDTSTVLVDTSVAKKNKEEDKEFTPKTCFSIDAGANYALGWKNNSVKEAQGFNGVFGVSATHYFTKKWSMLVGLQYNSVAHLSFSTYTSTNMQYDFGYNESKTIVTPKTLYYLAIPVKVQYHFNDKNSLALGVNVAYLLNAESNMDVTTQSTFGSLITTSSKKWGYMDGFAKWDVQPAVAYRRKIYKALNICAEFYFGLADLKNNTIFGINKTEHNSGFKFTLSYNFYHK